MTVSSAEGVPIRRQRAAAARGLVRLWETGLSARPSSGQPMSRARLSEGVGWPVWTSRSTRQNMMCVGWPCRAETERRDDKLVLGVGGKGEKGGDNEARPGQKDQVTRYQRLRHLVLLTASMSTSS